MRMKVKEIENRLQVVPSHPLGDRMVFGERIKSLRRERGWTLAQTSQRSRLALSTISKAERGIISLTYDNILKLAFAFDMGMSELLADSAENGISQVVTVERKGQAQKIENHYD